MKFYFADSMDLVDPTFDFVSETRSADRVRHRDDQYPHELFATPPYDGLLVSKAIVDGSGGLSGKYSIAQRQRFLRVGAHRFFRLDARPETANLTIMGDCGAFTYVKEPEPPFSVTEVVEFYETAGFDAGLSLDHIVLAFNAKADEPMLIDTVPEDWRLRRELTIDLASEFLRTVQSRKSRFTPIGVAQGWSPKSYAKSVSSLQRIGYRRIALGGLVPLRTSEILSVLSAIRDGRTATDQLHLLGVDSYRPHRCLCRGGGDEFRHYLTSQKGLQRRQAQLFHPESHLYGDPSADGRVHATAQATDRSRHD